MNKHYEIIVVVGPTASGKSDFAVKLAKECNGEIISADSRQIYKGLDIGTGKITHKEMCGVPHHMLDVIDINQNFSVAEYKRRALPLVVDILARGKTPIICGGTGQYIDSLIFNQSIPEVEPNLVLRAELEQKTTKELYTLLQQKDKRRAQEIDKHNRVRIIRSLEIIDSLGHVPEQITPTFRYPTTIYIMQPSRELLRKKVARRLEKRLNTGMLEEVQTLISKNIPKNTLKKFGIEYVIIAQYLNKEIDEETMKQEIVTKSMQYAKRQDTWNKKYLPYATIINVTE
jgi:tRNA dimethylallyltransferase